MYIEIEKESKDDGSSLMKRRRYHKWAYKKLDTDKFSEAIEWGCVGITPISDVQQATKWLTEIITTACDFAMPRAKNPKRPGVYWWSSEIQNLRKDTQKARRMWQKVKAKGKNLEIILEKEEAFRSIKKELGNTIKRAKRRAWEELINTIDRDPWGLPYRIVLGKLRRSSPSLTEILDPDILLEILNKLFPDDDDNEQILSCDDEENDHLNSWRDEFLVSTEELYSILRKAGSSNKAPGIDGFKTVYIRRIPKILMDKIRNVFNACLRDGIFPKVWKRSILILIPKGELNMNQPKVRPIDRKSVV